MELQKSRFGGTIHPNDLPLHGVIEIGAAGAIVNQTGQRDCGVTFTRNAAGDYRGTIHRGYTRCLGGHVDVIAPAAATAQSLTTGTDADIQGISSANMLGTSPISTFAIATVRPDTGVLADPVNGQFLAWSLWVTDSK